jgi:phosphoribosyl 1,2-cyclic phosphodiesterase
LLESSKTRVIVDAGLSYRRLVKRFEAIGRPPPTDVSAVIVTHSHSDHATHASTYATRFGCPVHASEPTMKALRLRESAARTTLPVGRASRIGDLTIHAREIPHDAPQVALRFEAQSGSVGLVTDLGRVPKGLASFLDGCGVLLLESNHDSDMLAEGPYPAHLKRRVGGSRGHLSNEQASDLLAALPNAPSDLVLMHLSETNNSPKLARCSAEAVLGHGPTKLHIAKQRHPTELGLAEEPQLQLGLYR